MPDPQSTIITALLEQLITTGPESLGQVFTALFDLAMRLERERHLGAERYERSPERRGYANGYKPKILDTPAGTLTVQVPKTRDADEPFFPQSLERGRRSCRAVMLAIAEMSEAEVHWRSFLDDLVGRGLRGVRFIPSDDHAGLRAARQAVFPGAQWQRCQFHLAQNAIHHAPNATIRKAIGAELRRVWNASTLVSAQEELDRLVKTYQSTAPKLATWLESAVPEGLTVFSLPDQHRRRMRTANPIERAIQQEIKRRTSKVRVFPNEASLLRLVTAILVEIDEDWATTDRVYINMLDHND